MSHANPAVPVFTVSSRSVMLFTRLTLSCRTVILQVICMMLWTYMFLLLPRTSYPWSNPDCSLRLGVRICWHHVQHSVDHWIRYILSPVEYPKHIMVCFCVPHFLLEILKWNMLHFEFLEEQGNTLWSRDVYRNMVCAFPIIEITLW